MPIRTCLACGRRAEKEVLLRFVLESSDTQFKIVGDVNKAKIGRGYYIHGDIKCLSPLLGWRKMVDKVNSFLNKSSLPDNICYLKVEDIGGILDSFRVAWNQELCRLLDLAAEELKSGREFSEKTRVIKGNSKNSLLLGSRIKSKKE